MVYCWFSECGQASSNNIAVLNKDIGWKGKWVSVRSQLWINTMPFSCVILWCEFTFKAEEPHLSNSSSFTSSPFVFCLCSLSTSAEILQIIFTLTAMSVTNTKKVGEVVGKELRRRVTKSYPDIWPQWGFNNTCTTLLSQTQRTFPIHLWFKSSQKAHNNVETLISLLKCTIIATVTFGVDFLF